MDMLVTYGNHTQRVSDVVVGTLVGGEDTHIPKRKFALNDKGHLVLVTRKGGTPVTTVLSEPLPSARKARKAPKAAPAVSETAAAILAAAEALVAFAATL